MTVTHEEMDRAIEQEMSREARESKGRPMNNDSFAAARAWVEAQPNALQHAAKLQDEAEFWAWMARIDVTAMHMQAMCGIEPSWSLERSAKEAQSLAAYYASWARWMYSGSIREQRWQHE
jgi:hypothetical protein